eukprot:2306735-Amphidinium_carterae.3
MEVAEGLQTIVKQWQTAAAQQMEVATQEMKVCKDMRSHQFTAIQEPIHEGLLRQELSQAQHRNELHEFEAHSHAYENISGISSRKAEGIPRDLRLSHQDRLQTLHQRGRERGREHQIVTAEVPGEQPTAAKAEIVDEDAPEDYLNIEPPSKLERVHVRRRKRLYSRDWRSTRLRNYKPTG